MAALWIMRRGRHWGRVIGRRMTMRSVGMLVLGRMANDLILKHVMRDQRMQPGRHNEGQRQNHDQHSEDNAMHDLEDGYARAASQPQSTGDLGAGS